jgi:SAM-dependent methyltransferase
LTHASPATTALTFTGERFTPELRGPIWYEHWHRYAFVAEAVRGKRVLDAACGEGFGSFLLAQSAAHVMGVDISSDAIAHASGRYSRPNLEFVPGSVTRLPLPDASVDVVVSFETIEHLTAQSDMLAEFRRVLVRDGVLVISSPNRPVYNEAGAVENHFHVAELDRAELKSLLAPAFPEQAWFAQRVVAQSALWNQDAGTGDGQFLALKLGNTEVVPEPAPPMYFVVVCAGPAVALPAFPALSLFDDGAQALWRDYARALGRERQLAWDELDARSIAEDRLADLVTAVNALASEKEAGIVKDRRLAALEIQLAEAIVARDAVTGAHAREATEHAQTKARLSYRESLRGWLRFPLAAMKRWVAMK